MEPPKDPPKRVRPPPRRRNMEKRRFTAKLASRVRRTTESDLVRSLGRALPCGADVALQLDKPAILRLAVANLKLRELFGGSSGGGNVDGHGGGGSPTAAVANFFPFPVQCWDSDLEELLHGEFLIVLSAAGTILYLSESVSDCSGYNNWELIGKSVYEFVHPSDWSDVLQLLALDHPEGHGHGHGGHGVLPPGPGPHPRSAVLRLKSHVRTGTSKESGSGSSSSSSHSRHATTLVVHINGNLHLGGGPHGNSPYFVGVGRRIPHPSDNDFPFPFISTRIFTTLRSTDNAKFLRIDQNVEHHIRFAPTELTQMRWFELLHAEDAHMVKEQAKEVHSKGQITSDPFRLLVKGGGWVWVIGEVTKIQGSGSSSSRSPSSIYCRYIVLGGVESNEILSLAQLPAAGSCPSARASEFSGMDATDDEQGSFGHDEYIYGYQDQTQDNFRSHGSSSEEERPLEDWDDMTVLQTLTADVDFTMLPAFVQALDALLFAATAAEHDEQDQEGESRDFGGVGVDEEMCPQQTPQPPAPTQLPVSVQLSGFGNLAPKNDPCNFNSTTATTQMQNNPFMCCDLSFDLIEQ